MQQSIGYYIRQLRRKRNLTQAELGRDLFSKSYVSAVENGRLAPSTEALRHFAVCLGESNDYFIALTRQMNLQTPLLIEGDTHTTQRSETINMLVHEKVALLEALLEDTGYTDFQVPESFFTLSPEALALLPLTKQAHYYFCYGMMLRKKADYTSAIQAFELALARENHPKHSVAILDELSRCYLYLHRPQIALHYTLRAHQTLLCETSLVSDSTLRFRIESRCGRICLMLSMYQQALEHFEQARVYLNAQQGMRHIGRLYWGLGYCTYALTYQQAYIRSRSAEQIERQYQHALSYLLQSHNIAQMAGDLPEARRQRLMLAMLQLDLSIWRRRHLSEAGGESLAQKSLQLANLSSLLDDANEHCRQVLMSLREGLNLKEPAALELTRAAYTALAFLIRIRVQRALLAYSIQNNGLLRRERALVASFCQQVLDACQDMEQLEALVWNMGNVSGSSLNSPPSPSLPRLPEIALPQEDSETVWSVLIGHAEVYWATGELAEMLGRTATEPDFTDSCYACADSCFFQALERLRLSQTRQYRYEAGYLTRAYQRYIALLEERLCSKTNQEQHASQVASTLLALCKQQLLLSQGSCE
jgi:transcriptional regulator with XRE-family HTH domain